MPVTSLLSQLCRHVGHRQKRRACLADGRGAIRYAGAYCGRFEHVRWKLVYAGGGLVVCEGELVLPAFVTNSTSPNETYIHAMPARRAALTLSQSAPFRGGNIVLGGDGALYSTVCLGRDARVSDLTGNGTVTVNGSGTQSRARSPPFSPPALPCCAPFGTGYGNGRDSGPADACESKRPPTDNPSKTGCRSSA